MVGGIRAGFHSWDTAVAKQPKYPIEDESCGTPMLYSSGTTGQPKGVHVPAYGECVNTPPALVPYLADTFEFDASTVYLSTAPLYHAAPLHYSMMTLYQGGTIVVMEKYGSERALKLIERHRVTHSQWVPIMFIRMLKLPRVLRESYDTTSMRMAIHAAAPCPIEVKEKMIDWWGETLMEYYSSNEGIGVSIINSNDWLTHRGSVGQPLVGDLYILNEKGEELRPGQTGAIYFGGEHVRFNYHREPAMTQAAYDKRGRATSGDLGYVDEDGFLYLTGRQSFTITSSGISIHPQEVENILANHDKVADVAVFGIPHAEHGEEVKAVIEPVSWDNATEETAAEILQWLGRQISNAKIPNSLDFHPKLPRMDNGKLYKQSLMDQYSR
jgi:fatty-acyl-CoA synthase